MSEMFSYKTKLRFSQCDPAGIMFYARIFELCHAAYEELVDGMQIDDDFWSNDIYAVPITKSEAQYFKPLRRGDEVHIAVTVEALTDTSYDVRYECKDVSGAVCVMAKTSHVIVDRKTFKRQSMRDDVRAALSKHLETSG